MIGHVHADGLEAAALEGFHDRRAGGQGDIALGTGAAHQDGDEEIGIDHGKVFSLEVFSVQQEALKFPQVW
ncbi:hypothetical protein llg_24730 [Luteolibacter sp. LG18]|nr:hypothetical protein llg_24730 [Luteolibacter sp. LG18]